MTPGRRGTGAMPPAHLDMVEEVKSIEQHGFTLVEGLRRWIAVNSWPYRTRPAAGRNTSVGADCIQVKVLPARPPARRLPLLCLFPRLQKRLRRLSPPRSIVTAKHPFSVATAHGSVSQREKWELTHTCD